MSRDIPASWAADEDGTLTAAETHPREVVEPAIASHHGRIVKTTGDGMLVEFASAVDAVTCAVAVQRAMAERKVAMPADRDRISHRHQYRRHHHRRRRHLWRWRQHRGPARKAMAEPGGICCLGTAIEQIRGKARFRLRRSRRADPQEHRRAGAGIRESGRRRSPRQPPTVSPRPASTLPLPDKPSIAVLPFQNMSGDPEQEYFADGMVEEIITALSAFRAVRHRPQFEFHLQGARRRCEAGRARAWGALRARRQRSQRRQPGAHHRAAHRYRTGRTSLGRPVRWRVSTTSSICRTR